MEFSTTGFQLALLLAETVAVAMLILGLFRARRYLGLAPLYIALGVFQYLQVVLSMSIYVEIGQGILISPGSAVLFTGSLFAILLVYIREDAVEARKLVYGIMLANVALSFLSVLFGLHLRSPSTLNLLSLPQSLFFENPRILLVGTATLWIDVLLIIFVYEAVFRVFRKSTFLRIFTSMSIVLVVDTVLFVTGGFLGVRSIWPMLVSGIVGKLGVALVYTAVVVIFLYIFDDRASLDSSQPAELRDVFQTLTYRQRFEALSERAQRDPLTGVFNRGFFDEALPLELARSARLGQPVSLLLIDLDHFKSINDRFGHQIGDRVLRCFACEMTERLRGSDIPCRYGGEEFSVILPNASGSEAKEIADEIIKRGKQSCAVTEAYPTEIRVTATVGVSTFPVDAESPDELFKIADSRLYAGKKAGRNRVVWR